MTPVSVSHVLDGVRRHLRRKGAALACLTLVAIAGGVLGLAWLLAGPQGWTPGTAVPLLLLVAGGLAATGAAAWVLFRLRRWGSEGTLSGEVERSARLPEGSVRSHVELARSLPPGVSASLARAGEEALLVHLADGPRRLAGGAGREVGAYLRVAGAAAAAAVLLVATLAWVAPDRTRTAWAGLARPGAILVPEPLPPLEIHPGTARLPRDEPPRVQVRAEGRDSVTVHWKGVGEVEQERSLAASDGGAELHLPPLTSEVAYWASSPDGARTSVHRLTPVDPSLVTGLVVEVRPPPHTRLPSEVHRGQPPALAVPVGSELRIRGGLSGEGGAVLLRERGGPELARFPVGDGTFEGIWIPAASAVAGWEVEGGTESAAALPDPLEVEVIPDRPPEVALPLPGRDMDLPLSLRLPLLLEAGDDYGVIWVEVEAGRLSADGEIEDPVVERMPTGDRRRVMVRPVLDLSEWGLEAGAEVGIRARAGDNAPATQVSESPMYRLRVPSATRVREMARERIQGAADRVGGLAERTDRAARELRELESRIRTGSDRGDGPGYQDREELREAVEAREAALREMEAIRDELEEARRALGEGGEEDAGLRERLRELGQLLEDALDPEARQRLADLLEGLRGGEDPPVGEAMDDLIRDQERLRDRLEEALERLRRTALEAAFEGAEAEVRALSEAQEALLADLAESGGADEQEALAERTGALEERLKALERHLSREGSPETGSRAAEAGEDLSRAREGMERAAEAARAGEGRQAAEAGEGAADEVREALRQMEEARMDWLAEWEDQIRDAFRRAAEDALGLARKQAELRERIQHAGPMARSELQGEMAAVGQGLRNLGAGVGSAARQVPAVGRELSRAIGEAMEAVERTAEGLRGRREGTNRPHASAGRALEAMNRVALLALEGMDRDGEGSDGGAMEQLLDELEALAAQQGAVNQEAASLAGEPDEGGAQARMDEVAAAQEAIAGTMDELAGQPGGERSLGDLEELANEAREIARELDEGRLDATTLARQERLLDRLLSAGRTLEREGDTEEREGTPAGPVDRTAVDPLSRALLTGLAVPLPTAAELESLSPGERRMVLEYFERMNRRRAGGGGP